MTSRTEPDAFALRGVRAEHRDGWLRRRKVLNGVDLSAARGATLGLVGTNGAGKSTLLRIVAGIAPASGGQVEVLCGSPAEPAIRQRIGHLGEESTFPPDAGALEVMKLLGTLRGLGARESRDRGRRMLERVGLGAELRTHLGRFSRGMTRRFGLAQAVLHDPELLLLDEPTAGLDAPGFEVFDQLLDEARHRGATAVLTSHLGTDLLRQADELAVLHLGRVAERGSPAALLDPGDAHGGAPGDAPGDAARTGTEGRRGSAEGGLLALYRRLGSSEGPE